MYSNLDNFKYLFLWQAILIVVTVAFIQVSLCQQFFNMKLHYLLVEVYIQYISRFLRLSMYTLFIFGRSLTVHTVQLLCTLTYMNKDPKNS